MMHPYRTAIDMGIPVAGHSDSTVSAADPLLRIQDMVTRKGEKGIGYGVNQRVSVEEAIEVWTLVAPTCPSKKRLKDQLFPAS
jgi:predicted amidohydrolase YtcJ